MDDRAHALLKALIERYIADGQPVGSRTLSKVFEGACRRRGATACSSIPCSPRKRPSRLRRPSLRQWAVC